VFLFFPVSFPLAKLLDKCLGKHHELCALSVNDFKKLLEHKQLTTRPDQDDSLSSHQLPLIYEAMDLSKLRVKDFSAPLDQVCSLSDQDLLDAKCLDAICRHEFRRIPLYRGADPSALYSVLLTKG
jgi:metal transporter CNNM